MTKAHYQLPQYLDHKGCLHHRKLTVPLLFLHFLSLPLVPCASKTILNTMDMGRGAPLPQSSNCSRGVEDDLSSIHAVHEPIEWMMTAVANIHSNLPKLCLEHCVASVALHVICRLSRKHETMTTAVFQFLHSHSGLFRSLTSLKSPILGMWFFLLFPSTFPELEMTTAVFHRVPCNSSLSRIGETMTMLYFLAS